MNPLASGLARTFRGLRTGDPQLILMGAALLAFAWLRSRPSEKVLIYKKTLKEGQAVNVRFDQPS